MGPIGGIRLKNSNDNHQNIFGKYLYSLVTTHNCYQRRSRYNSIHWLIVHIYFCISYIFEFDHCTRYNAQQTNFLPIRNIQICTRSILERIHEGHSNSDNWHRWNCYKKLQTERLCRCSWFQVFPIIPEFHCWTQFRENLPNISKLYPPRRNF